MYRSQIYVFGVPFQFSLNSSIGSICKIEFRENVSDHITYYEYTRHNHKNSGFCKA